MKLIFWHGKILIKSFMAIKDMTTFPVLAQIRLLTTYLTDIIWAVQIQQMSNDDSPCIGMCTLNKDGVCIGCNRTLEEIHESYLESIGYYDKSN